MAFSFETSGNNTFLVYTVEENDTLDTLTLGMITNNRIPGMLPVLYTQRNLEQFLKYNVTAKVTVRQFFSGIVNRRRLLGVFSGVVDALETAEEYMIDQNSVLLDIDYIYADVSTCKAEVICLPIINTAGPSDIKLFFKNIMFSTQFDQTENCDYVAKIINYLNRSGAFSVGDFRQLLEALQGIPATAAPVPPVYEPVQQDPSPLSKQPAEKAPVRPKVQDIVPPQENPSHIQQNVKTAGESVVSGQSGVQGGVAVPGQNGAQGGFAVPGQNGAQGGFAVPGQNGTQGGFAVPGQSDAQGVYKTQGKQASVQRSNSAESQKAAEEQKDMSVFYLLQHYNKENAAIFKAQKEAKKAGGKQTSRKKNDPASGFEVPGQQPVQPRQQTGQPQQNFVQPQSAPIHPQQQPQTGQPVPFRQPDIQAQQMGENFGDTVIMDEEGYGEDTVVISEVQAAAVLKPYLLRLVNNEKIPLEKAVFHIGKERSYVDYCITGNATISRSHADIITKNGQCYIMDINSTNHTYVNDEMIPSNTEVPLAHGTKIRLSNEEFEFRTF